MIVTYVLSRLVLLRYLSPQCGLLGNLFSVENSNAMILTNLTFATVQKLMGIYFLNVFCWFAPFGYLYFSYFSMNEPELGAGIDPGMAFNPFPSSILVLTRQDSNPQPLLRESSPLTSRPDLRPFK